MGELLQLEALRQRRTRWGGLLVDGQSPADANRGVLQSTQHVVGLDLHGLSRHIRGDVRVAVTVTAHPAAEAEVRRHLRVDPGTAQRSLRCAVKRGGKTEQRLVEDGHRRTYFVQRVEAATAQQRRAPERRDLLE